MEGYTIVDGRITNPGKFEGEPRYSPYFYDLWADGEADEELYEDSMLQSIGVFKLNPEDYNNYPELVGYVSVRVTTDNNGFVYCIAE